MTAPSLNDLDRILSNLRKEAKGLRMKRSDIACAISSEVNIIVSGDKHLLDISGINGIAIMKPADFVKKYLG